MDTIGPTPVVVNDSEENRPTHKDATQLSGSFKDASEKLPGGFIVNDEKPSGAASLQHSMEPLPGGFVVDADAGQTSKPQEDCSVGQSNTLVQDLLCPVSTAMCDQLRPEFISIDFFWPRINMSASTFYSTKFFSVDDGSQALLALLKMRIPQYISH